MAETGILVAVSVEAEIREAERALALTSKSLKAIRRSVLSEVAKGTIQTINAAMPAFKNETGEMRKAYGYKIKKDASEVNVYPFAKGSDRDTIFPKAMTLSYGHTGPTKRTTKDWNIRALGFVQQGNAYAETGAYRGRLQAIVDRELKKNGLL